MIGQSSLTVLVQGDQKYFWFWEAFGGGFPLRVTQGVDGALEDAPVWVSSSVEDPFDDIPDSSRVVSPSAMSIESKYNDRFCLVQ